MRKAASKVVWIALVVVSLVAHAEARRVPDTPERKLAANEFKRGKQLYADGDYEGALLAFQSGFDAYPLRGFLVNIGQCQRKLGHLKEAVAAYEKFLDATDVPASLRAEVEEALAEVKEAEAEAAPAPPKPAPTIEPEPATPPPTTNGATLTSDAEVKKAAPAKKKSRAWVWVLVGVGAAAVVGGVTAGVILGTRASSPSGGSLGLIDGRSP